MSDHPCDAWDVLTVWHVIEGVRVTIHTHVALHELPTYEVSIGGKRVGEIRRDETWIVTPRKALSIGNFGDYTAALRALVRWHVAHTR